MKSDLDRLMAERGLDAVITLATEYENPIRTYLANGAGFSGMVIKRRGSAPVLLSNHMERGEAAKSGLQVYDYEDFGYGELLREYQNDLDRVRRAWYRRIFETLAIRGQVNVAGVGDLNDALRAIRLLEAELADRATFVTEPARQTVFDEVVETKDDEELARLHGVGQRASRVVRATRDWLATHRAEGDAVVDAAGRPLTIGDVKRYVREALFAEGLEDPEGMIFAQGADAARPHSKGEDAAPLRTGAPIVFDFFPREPRGYFHDMTRTWCLGHASPQAQALYDDVMALFDRSFALCGPGASTTAIQRAVCQEFEAQGHPTVLSTPSTARGYTHSLAHGVGLNLHEAPFFPTFGGDQYHLQPGSVFTLEPGLYYEEEGVAVRVEDTVYLNADGQLASLTDCPYDLVIELKR